MRCRPVRLALGFIAAAAVILILIAPAASQWQPLPSPQGPTGQTPQYPPQPVPYPPQQQQYPPQQQQYPPSQQSPPQQQQQPSQIQPGQPFQDVFGRFRVTLPGGTMPSGATYNFVVPTASAFVNIMSVPQDQMFQMQMRNFPTMLQQMGAKIDTNQQTDLRGKSAQFIAKSLEKAGRMDREKFIDALERMKVDSPVGEVAMRAYDHQAMLPMFMGVTKKVPQYPFLIGSEIVTIPAKDVMPSVDDIKKARGR